MLDSLTSQQTLFCSSFGSAWPRCAPRECARTHTYTARFRPALTAAAAAIVRTSYSATSLHAAVHNSAILCFQVWRLHLWVLLVWMNSNHPSPPIVGCTPHARLDRAVPLGIGEAASSKRLSGQRPTDRSGLAKDRSKQTASVSVCKGRVKWMFDLLSLAPAAFRAASSVSELWWDVSGFGQNPPDVQLWPKYEAVSARLWRLAAHVEWFWCSIECISACLLFQLRWFRKYFPQ